MAKRIGELFVDMGITLEREIDEALVSQEQGSGLLGEILMGFGYVTREDLDYALATQSGLEAVDLDSLEIPDDIIERVPASIAEQYQVVPFREDGGTLVLAMADANNPHLIDEIRFMLNIELRGAVSNEDAVSRAIVKYYGGEVGSPRGRDDVDASDLELLDTGEKQDLEEQMINDTGVVKLVNMILLQAIKDKAADVHMEPFETDFKVRYRIDGVLYEMVPPPAHLASAMTSRVKVMAHLDISERRLPQDGRIELTIGGKPVDLRVSTLPTMYGESVVMRILDRSNVSLDIENVGFKKRDLETLRTLIKKPNGVILVCGPTGSGKTTTLYSALSEINTPDKKIITSEDPVEFDLDGIIQVAIQPDIGLTYASILRAVLRQDPDVVFVGEIRDHETAGIAIEAALTGHLVFSTLHTNDAPSVVARLADLNCEHFLISATLEAVIAQRLVRRICLNCKSRYSPTDEELGELSLTLDAVAGREFYYGKGCKVCNDTGYKGRAALFEIMIGNDGVKEAILNGATTNELRRIAINGGMKTLRDAGLESIYDGVTTIEEVVKETSI